VLRSRHSVQAGFGKEEVPTTYTLSNPVMLHKDGDDHRRQRRQTARLFAPTTVDDRYRPIIEREAAVLVAEMVSRKRAHANDLSARLAVRVSAEVVGLTDSLAPDGYLRRIERVSASEIAQPGWRPRQLAAFVRMQLPAAAFFLLDVLPAIRARRRSPRLDLVSHLLAQGLNPIEILTECILFAAASIVTTREFITVALWHLLDQPALADRYRAAGQQERYAILNEILRLEPVLGHLYRRATADIPVRAGGQDVVVPANALVVLHLHDVTADPAVVGTDPDTVRPDRALCGRAVPADVIGFGDGHHRCPGSYLAIQETDILLRRLLALPGLRIAEPPTVSWNDVVDGYELRDFTLAVD
jgi:cytochrome P450